MMLPSQFLNIVLEEGEGGVNTKTEFFPEPSLPKKDVPQLLRPLRRLAPKSPKTTNNNHLFLGWESAKRLPEAFLAECTVEVCRGPVTKKPLPEPRFEVKLLPIYSKKTHSQKLNGGIRWQEYTTEKEGRPGPGEDDDVEMVPPVEALLSGVEAVYSDHESDSELDVARPPPNSVQLPNILLQPSISAPSLSGQFFKCKICPNVFSNKEALWQHTMSAHPEGLKNFECPICGRKFYRNCSLALHVKSHGVDSEEGGGGSEAVTCEVCGVEVSSTTALEAHMSSEHPEPELPPDRPHRCPFCNKSYSQKSVLKKHLVIHTGERLTCQLCGIDFTQKSSLLRHVKRMHVEGRLAARKRAKRVPALLSLQLTEHIKRVIAAAQESRAAPTPRPPPSLLLPPTPVSIPPLSPPRPPSSTSDDADSSHNPSDPDMPEQTAEFIQSLKIPQGISISMIDD